MATPLPLLPATVFAPIVAELQRKRLPTNFDRAVAGEGRSQAFGLIRRWSYTPFLSRMTWMRPELWCLLQEFAAAHVHIRWDAVQVNDNYQSAPHKDKGNEGDSYIVGFGDYTDGELTVETTDYDIHNKPHLFRGCDLLHSTKPWSGNRYSLVFFSIVWPTQFLPRYAITTELIKDGLRITNGYDNEICVIGPRGHIVRIERQRQPKEYITRVVKRGQPARAFFSVQDLPGQASHSS